MPAPEDMFHERLYRIQRMRSKKQGRAVKYEFRAIADLKRERVVEDHVATHLVNSQRKGWVPDMRVEPSDTTWNAPGGTRPARWDSDNLFSDKAAQHHPT